MEAFCLVFLMIICLGLGMGGPVSIPLIALMTGDPELLFFFLGSLGSCLMARCGKPSASCGHHFFKFWQASGGRGPGAPKPGEWLEKRFLL